MHVLFDYSNLAYLALYGSLSKHGIKPEEVPENYSAHVDFFTDKIGTLLNRCAKECKVSFVIDQNPVKKFSLFPAYKSGRTKLPVSPKTLLDPIIKDWDDCGWSTLYSEEKEADDVIASLVAQNKGPDRLVVVSADKDIWQVKDYPDVEVLNPLTYQYIDQCDILNKFGVWKFCQIKLYKSLWGDVFPECKSNFCR